jgi:histidinol-phosphate aminotransferase
VIKQRSNIAAIPPYRPGKSVVDGWAGPVYKLSSNENPYPPLPSVLDAIAQAASHIERYPNMAAPELTLAVAARQGVLPEQIAFGGGSVESAAQLIRAFAGDGDEVIFAWRSFEAYPLLVTGAGATPVQVPLTADHRHDLDAMLAAITDRTRVIFICTPNNPTGTVVRHDELHAFLSKVPQDILVVIDEAYVHFTNDPEAERGIELFHEFENVAVLHTFSKAYGMAGLRLGYAIVRDDVHEGLSKVAMPFALTDIAQAAGVASLAAEDELQERVDTLIAERDRVRASLAAAGWESPDSQANFVWLPARDMTDALNTHLTNHGLIVRPFSGYGIRVSIGEPAANDAFLAALETAPRY